jgi:porin
LAEILLPGDLKTTDKKGSYNVALSFSHLLYELPAKPGKGFGIYGKGAIADGNPNPIQASFVGGFAGHGVVPGRPGDVFGVGYYYYNFSDDLQQALAPIDRLAKFTSLVPRVEFGDEQGVEAYYNFAVTPWFHVTADLQWIAPARGALSEAWVGGLRANITF